MKAFLQITLVLLFFLSQTTFAQVIKRCATHRIDSLGMIKNPKRMWQKQLFENQLSAIIATQKSKLRVKSDSVIKIPVVVHVIHNNAQGIIGGIGNTNISDEQIYSQIRVLNEDYRKKINTLGYNTNPVGADAGLEFFLAYKDTLGNPTTGITRRYSSKSSFSLDTDLDSLSNLAYWNSNHYLNIWVVSIADNYSGLTPNFPGAIGIGGLDASDGDAKLDGVVIDYRAFGKKIGTSSNGLHSFGRTTTHEIGHFFGLLHTWGDAYCGTDYCDDTPQCATSNNSIYCDDVYSYCTGVKSLNLIQDYMDYSPDSCMNIFTNDQVARMKAVMTLSKRRQNLINYAKSLELPTSSSLQVLVYPNPVVNNLLQLQIILPDFENFKVELLNEKGMLLLSQSYTNSPSRTLQFDVSNISAGLYITKVTTTKESITKRIILTN